MNHTTIGITLIVTTIAIVEVNLTQIQQQRPQSQSPLELSGGNLNPVAVNGYSTTIQPTPILKVSKGDAHYPSPQEKSTIDRTINQTLSMVKLLERIINESHTCTSEAILCEYNNINNTIAFKL
jgi:hypothetical protein